MQIISPMVDAVFKRIFSQPDSKPMLCGFLTTFIEFKDGKIDDVKLIDKEIKRRFDEKGSVLDLRVEAEDTEVDVEVQLQGNNTFKDRMTYYLSKMFSDQLGENDSYDKLHKCVSLCITNFKLFDDEHYFRTMNIRDTYGNILTDKFEFGALEISKIRGMEITDGMDKKLQWAKLFAATGEEELNMLQQKTNDPAIEQAVLTVKKLSDDEIVRLEAEAEQKRYRDHLAFLHDAETKGRAEGRAEERASIAKNLRAMGMSEEQINAALGRRDQ